MSQPGCATIEGTAGYRKRFERKFPNGHFRPHQGLRTSSLGMKQLRHAEENLKAAQIPPVPWGQYAKLFKAS